MKTFLLIVTLGLVIITGFAMAQSNEDVKDTSVEEDLFSKTILIKKWIDQETGNLCYIYYGQNESISCVLNSDLFKVIWIMLNTKFPLDAQYARDWWGTFCTTIASDPVTGADICTNQIQTIVASTTSGASGIKTILSAQYSGNRSVELDLFCDGVLRKELNAQGFAYENPIVNCQGDITWAYQASLASEIWLDITWVPYDIRSTTMATNTPYISTAGYDNGIFYYHNPLIDQIGISLFLLTFGLFVWWIIKIFRKV